MKMQSAPTLALALILALGAVGASDAEASFSGPILRKTSFPGFTVPEELYTTDCRIYPDRVVVILGVSNLSFTEERKIQLSDISTAIADASKGEITKTSPIMGTAATSYSAAMVLPNDAAEAVDLGSRQMGYVTQNKSMAAAILRSLIDRICNDRIR